MERRRFGPTKNGVVVIGQGAWYLEDGERGTVFAALRQGIVAACERSPGRLGTGRLDCYLLHWPGEHPLEETFARFEQLQREGKILCRA